MRLLRPITVKTNKKALRGFKAIAKQFYPREAWGALFGHDRETSEGRVIEIQEIWIPDDLAENVGRGRVYWQDYWWGEVQEHSEESGLSLVGDIHSHPGFYSELHPSSTDLLNCRWDGLMAILGVLPSGRSRLQVWGPMVPVVSC